MNIEFGIKEYENDYANVLITMRNEETLRAYTRSIRKFLDLISDSVFAKCTGTAPASRRGSRR